MLDDILELLDTPRQAITNLARSAFGDADPLAGLPGGLGLIGALGLGATGIGLPLALLGGSAIGGMAQSGGNSTGNDVFRAPSPEDVAKGMFGSDDFISSLLAGALTDPLTYAGGIGGGRLGAKLGREAEIGAEALGPGFKGKNALLDAIRQADLKMAGRDSSMTNWFASHMDDLPPGQIERIASEIPEGSSFLGSGLEGLALKTPQGDAIRVGFRGVPKSGRPISEFVNPATRTVDVASPANKVRVERSPLAEIRGPEYWGDRLTPESEISKLRDRALDTGVEFFDAHPGNAGFVGGKPVIIDSGAFEASKRTGFQGGYSPVTEVDSATSTGILPRLLGQPRLRQAIEQGRSTDNLGLERLLSRLGAGLGTGSVVTERAF